MQAKQLQRVQMELLAVRESLHPLQKKQHRELLKDEPNLIQLDHLVEAIKPLAAVEQQLLRERERLETQSRSERRRLEAQGEGEQWGRIPDAWWRAAGLVLGQHPAARQPIGTCVPRWLAVAVVVHLLDQGVWTTKVLAPSRGQGYARQEHDCVPGSASYAPRFVDAP